MDARGEPEEKTDDTKPPYRRILTRKAVSFLVTGRIRILRCRGYRLRSLRLQKTQGSDISEEKKL
jgi:hypothetical protein